LKNLKISDFDPMRTRADTSTSEIHFIISKMVSAVTADATEVPMPKDKTVYPLQGGKVHPNFENRKKFPEKNFKPPLRPKNTLIPLVKAVFKSVDNYGRYLQFCDRRVWSFQ